MSMVGILIGTKLGHEECVNMSLSEQGGNVSQTQSHISNISCICQEICHIKRRRRPRSISQTSNNTIMDEGGTTDPMRTQEPSSNSSVKGDNSDEGCSDGTYSSHSTLCPHEPSNCNSPSHHAPVPPSLNPMSGNWTWRIYVFLQTFIFLCFSHNFLLCFSY